MPRRNKNNHNGNNNMNGNNWNRNNNRRTFGVQNGKNSNYDKQNNRNMHNRLNSRLSHDRRYANNDHDDETFIPSRLPKNEEIALARVVKSLWKEGQDLDGIVEEVEIYDNLCPRSLKRASDRVLKLANAVFAILEKEKLITHKGNPRPTKWPGELQLRIAFLALNEDTSPENIRDELKYSDDYKATFDHSWNWGNVACSIGHFIGAHQDQLEVIASGAHVVQGSDERSSDTALEPPEDCTEHKSRGLIESLSAECWAKKLLESTNIHDYDPNYVNSLFAFANNPPRFGDPSRFVIRQASPHHPDTPDPLPDPVRPISNVPYQPRRCQGTHGCSRHCSWNGDLHCADGWSQHNFNNKHGILMYMHEQLDEVRFEDADGDVIMADNYPPWMLDEPDADWR